MNPKKIIELADKHESSAKRLIETVNAAYPPGSIIRAKITAGSRETWIEAEVMESLYKSTRFPLEVTVRNTRTGKTRSVSADPRSHYQIELVCLPQNAALTHPESKPITPEQPTDEGLSSSVSLADLIEHWERRCVALDMLVEDAKKTANEETIARLQGKASMARSMTVELKREIRSANAHVEARRK
jgi:hypothetical protein